VRGHDLERPPSHSQSDSIEMEPQTEQRVHNRFMMRSSFCPLDMQRTESLAVCEACHHPREAHQEWGREESSTQSPLPMRAHCGVRGCSCRSYVGLVWARPSR